MSLQLSQDEIDRLFRARAGARDDADGGDVPATLYDFRRPDRIPKDQLRSIYLMHDFLARNLASSLGAYLRAYVSVTLASVDQISFGEFLQYLPTPSCISSVAMPQMDGSAVLEVNPSVAMPILDVLLGGVGKVEEKPGRELTEIEQSIFEGVLRVILQDLRSAWAPVATIDFKVDAIETQPQLMRILSPNEAIVAIGFEITMGEARGMMSFGMPSILIKTLGQKFDQQWSIRRRASSETDHGRMRQMAKKAPVRLHARVGGAKITVDDLMRLEPGDVVSLETSVRRPVRIYVAGAPKFEGEVVSRNGARAVEVLRRLHSAPKARTKEAV